MPFMPLPRMAADGTSQGGDADLNRNQVVADTIKIVTSALYGMSVGCAQCHDHPTDRWKREQFHELAAFFPRVASRVILTPDRRDISVVLTRAPDLRSALVAAFRSASPQGKLFAERAGCGDRSALRLRDTRRSSVRE